MTEPVRPFELLLGGVTAMLTVLMTAKGLPSICMEVSCMCVLGLADATAAEADSGTVAGLASSMTGW